jgi:hypothetical protein
MALLRTTPLITIYANKPVIQKYPLLETLLINAGLTSISQLATTLYQANPGAYSTPTTAYQATYLFFQKESPKPFQSKIGILLLQMLGREAATRLGVDFPEGSKAEVQPKKITVTTVAGQPERKKNYATGQGVER